MPTKVSVIVPVYNPGHHIDDCIASLLGQSLPDDEYEAIFVDDGSTDETPARLDALAAEHPHVHVRHIPNSGWPGRPRNIGIDMARGEYVYFVDNDDWLEPEALERMYAKAREDDADIVIGKVVGRGKSVPHMMFRENQSGLSAGTRALLSLLTPHKLFRRALLTEHDIRFPEGKRRLEDHVFVMHAYFHGDRRISVLADYPCYHWVLRETRSNASYQRLDPVGYFQNVREVLDLVREHTEPGERRERLLLHWYRGKMLKRVGGRAFLNRPPDYRAHLYEEIRRLALERYDDDGIERRLSFALRVRSRLLRKGRYEGLQDLARFEGALACRAQLRELRPLDDGLRIRFDAALVGREGPLRFVQDGTRLRWVPPATLDGLLPDELLDATEELPKSLVRVLARHRVSRAEYQLPVSLQLRLDRDGDAVTPVVVADATLDPRAGAAGSPLQPGSWEIRVLTTIVGFNETAPLMDPDPPVAREPSAEDAADDGERPAPPPAPLIVTVTRDGRALRREKRKKPPPPPPSPPTLRRRVARRVPRLARALVRVRAVAR